MSAFYSNLDQTARRLIRQFGKTAYLITPGEKTGPEWDPTIGPDLLTELVVLQDDTMIDYRDNTLIQAGDRVLWAASEVPIKQGKAIAVDEKRFELVQVDQVAPGPVVLLYKMLARGPGAEYPITTQTFITLGEPFKVAL